MLYKLNIYKKNIKIFIILKFTKLNKYTNFKYFLINIHK